MPLAVMFRDIDKDILDAVHCSQYEDQDDSDSDSDSGNESDDNENIFDNGDFMTTTQHQVPNHGRCIPLNPLVPESGTNLLSPMLLDMLSDIPPMATGGMEVDSGSSNMLATDQGLIDDTGDDLKKAFADW